MTRRRKDNFSYGVTLTPVVERMAATGALKQGAAGYSITS